jgi:capsular exopolysaccharide synthesis family protein
VGQRVLLIDADVRRPKLHRIFNVSNDVSLGDILKARDGVDIADAAVGTLVRPTPYPGLHVLPTGSGWMNTAGLLHSPKLEVLLRKFRTEFDVILIDTAPALNMFDARVVARLADAVILVLRMGQTTKDSALAAIRRLSEDGTHVLGLILNDWDPNRSQGYNSYYGNDVYLARHNRANAHSGNR